MNKCVPVYEIIIFKHNGKFVTTEPENGAVLENITDQLAGCFQILIALVMSMMVVDLFQVIAVKTPMAKANCSP